MNAKIVKRAREEYMLKWFIRGYDSQWFCHYEKEYTSSAHAERICTDLNKNPMAEYNYVLEIERV